MDTNYWVVGAMFGGKHDALPDFLRRGYWYCWEPHDTETNSAQGKGQNSQAKQRDRFKQIAPGDRIAVKKRLGGGKMSGLMEIRALGIVKDVDFDEWRVYVDWLTDESFSRQLPIGECGASIHGPFQFATNNTNKDSWLHQIFCV